MIRYWAGFFALVLVSFASPLHAQTPASVNCQGPLVQGGFLICRLPENFGSYRIETNTGKTTNISHEHPALIPFSRNSPLDITLRFHPQTAASHPAIQPQKFTLSPGQWDIERIDGLPPGKVTPRSAKDQKKVAADWGKKQKAWKHRAPSSWYANGFIEPVAKTRTSGVFGSQRILNGQPKNPHLGLDFAAPKGTPIIAPARAEVVLAEPDMYFEGGLLVLDHGAGVMSVMLHMSSLDVAVGDIVAQGQKLGSVGMTGRATGPHLHWGIKVRGSYINPELVLGFAG
ncbi:Phage lysin, 1,4-beta-N-acetylmuramidase or lysozyme |uniref:Phage lysin, 1,4-beta-N-acetylmuramidase or lysozyme \